jgi:hypothetical protein
VFVVLFLLAKACTGSSCYRGIAVIEMSLFATAPSPTAHLTNNALHAVLVKTVRQVSGISRVYENRWITWVHKWSATKVRDPDLYATSFLSDYLRDIGNNAVTEKETADLFQSEQTRYVRPEGELKKMRYCKNPCIEEVFFLVGSVGLEARFGKSLQSEGFVYHEMSLPWESILHSGVAVSYLLAALDEGSLAKSAGVTLHPGVRINVLHAESAFKTWPRSEKEFSYVNRFDKMTHVLRCFGVDASASRAMESKKVRSVLDQRLNLFAAVGVASFKAWPTFVVNVDRFIPAMKHKGRLVLTDNLLLGEVFQARKTDSCFQTNTSGVMCWDGDPKPESVFNLIRFLSDSKSSSVLIILLSPHGVRLTNTRQVRVTPEDISFHSE